MGERKEEKIKKIRGGTSSLFIFLSDDDLLLVRDVLRRCDNGLVGGYLKHPGVHRLLVRDEAVLIVALLLDLDDVLADLAEHGVPRHKRLAHLRLPQRRNGDLGVRHSLTILPNLYFRKRKKKITKMLNGKIIMVIVTTSKKTI